MSNGRLLRQALDNERPLQMVGVPNAFVAIMAQHLGYRALYLSGAGVANLGFGLPDLGLTTLDDVLEEARRITGAVDLPLLVDVDTGFGGTRMIARTIREMTRTGAAGVHIEDQQSNKRCGHRPGKQLVRCELMVDRIKAAVDAKASPDFVVMARTDAVGVEGLDQALERAVAYQGAGADMLFAEAVATLDDYARFRQALKIPILANLTEFGQTPTFTLDQLRTVGVDIALYPLSVARIMNRAAEKILKEIRTKGTQRDLVDEMLTRHQLYEYLDYYKHEEQSQENKHGRNTH